MLARTSVKAKEFLPWLFTRKPSKKINNNNNNNSGIDSNNSTEAERGEEEDEDDYGASLKEFSRMNQHKQKKDRKTIFIESLLKGIEIGAIGAVGTLVGAKLVLGASPRAQRFIVNQISNKLIKRYIPNFEFYYGEVHYNPILNRVSFRNGSVVLQSSCPVPKTFGYMAFVHFERLDFTLPFLFSLISGISSNLLSGIYIKGATVFLDLRNIHRPLPSSPPSPSSLSSSAAAAASQQNLQQQNQQQQSSSSDLSSSQLSVVASSGNLSHEAEPFTNSQVNRASSYLKGITTGKIKNIKIVDSHAVIITKNQKKRYVYIHTYTHIHTTIFHLLTTYYLLLLLFII